MPNFFRFYTICVIFQLPRRCCLYICNFCSIFYYYGATCCSQYYYNDFCSFLSGSCVKATYTIAVLADFSLLRHNLWPLCIISILAQFFSRLRHGYHSNVFFVLVLTFTARHYIGLYYCVCFFGPRWEKFFNRVRKKKHDVISTNPTNTK